MSRCFPFPPPGYEKKARDGEAELLIKDKQKEKKHKKEKKDKKKEGRDKDKDRSKDKDRDKKERKEKHKDKKSKDKRKTDESKHEGPGECSNGGKHLDNNQQSETIKNTKFVDVNPRVVADEERGGRDQMAENHPSSTNRKDDEGGVGILVDKYFGNCVQDKESIKGKEPDKKMERQRINDEGKLLGNAMVAGFSSAEQKRAGAPVRPMEKDAAMAKNFSSAEKKRVGATIRPMEKEAAMVTSFSSGTIRPMEKEAAMVTSFSSATSSSSAEQRRVGDAVRPMEKDAERKMEAKDKKKEPVVIEAPRKMEGEEKKRELVGNDVAIKKEGKEKKKDSERKEKKKEKEEKRKHRDGEKKSKEKKSSEKEKMKEKLKNENNNMIIEQVVPKVDRINTLNIKPIQIPTPKDSDTGSSRDDSLNLKKRKESDTNGFLHDNVPPNKLPRPTISSTPLPFPMNGRKQDLSQPQPISPFAVAVQRGPNSIRFDNKVLKANGLIQAPPPPPTSTSTSSSLPPIKAKENGESSRKPHPDTKYLSQILSVPKMDDWSDFDDQEWLFSNEGKKKQSSGMEDDIPQVWDRAMQIDSADLCALPYVIPY